MPETKRPLKVFLCHASADKPKVRELYRTLKRRGVQPWLDAENLIPGQNWEVEIPKALLSSDAIIICLSPNSVDKEGYVQKEIKFALDKALEMPEGRIFLIPARLEDCDLPFSLRQYQAVNLYEKEGYTKLMKALKLRASQLERNTVDLPKDGELAPEIKKVVEEKEPVEPKQEKPEAKIFAPLHKPSSQAADASEQEKPSPVKPEEKRIETPNAKVEKSESKKTKSPRKMNTAIIVALIGLVGTIIAALLGSPMIEKWLLISTVSPTLTSKPPTPFYTPMPTEITAANNVTMRLVNSGEFLMGSNDENYPDEYPLRPVYLDAYYIDKFEVTNLSYEACVDAGDCKPPNPTTFYGDPNYINHPVVYVKWEMAKAYCEWRGNGTRLPSEAEWEKAAHGKFRQIYPWTDDFGGVMANYDNNQGTLPVSSYPNGVSPYGVYNMAGNVREWVFDWYDVYSDGHPNASVYFGQKFHVLRGGAWDLDDNFMRTTDRDFARPDFSDNNIGFRCARSVP